MLLFWSSLSFYLRIEMCWDKVTAIRMFFFRFLSVIIKKILINGHMFFFCISNLGFWVGWSVQQDKGSEGVAQDLCTLLYSLIFV